MSTSLEVLPVELRGVGSGVLQQGYTVGYLIAAVINLVRLCFGLQFCIPISDPRASTFKQTLVPHNPHGWRALFWVAAGLSFLGGTFRMFLPESPLFLCAQRDRRLAIERGEAPLKSRGELFLQETRSMLKRHWLLCVYAVLMMTGFNFLSHGSQGTFQTFSFGLA